MKSRLEIVLNVAVEQLEQQKQEQDPTLGVNGHLYFLVRELAQIKLNRREQQQVQYILALHQQCTYPNTRNLPDIGWEIKTGGSSLQRLAIK